MNLNFKWYNCSCFQMEYDGVRIAFDPFLNESNNKGNELEDMVNIDEVFISHAHFDHISHLDEIYEKNNCKVILSNMIASEIVQILDLSSQLVYPVYPNVEEFIDTVKVTPLFGRHAIPSRIDRHLVKESKLLEGLPPHIKNKFSSVMHYGFMDLVNYHIAFEDGKSILFYAGSTNIQNIRKLEGIRTEVLFLQIPSNSVEDNLALINTVKPKIVIPHHHDGYTGDKALLLKKLQEGIELLDFDCTYMDINLKEWYSIEL